VFLFGVESVLLKGRGLNRWNSPPGNRDGEHKVSDTTEVSTQASTLLLDRTSLVALGVILCGMLFSGYLAWPHPQPDTSRAFSSIPQTVGEWQGTDTRLSEREYELLGTDNVLSRMYRSSNNKPAVQLVIVMAEQLRRRTHPPEQCLTGSGWSLRHIDEKRLSTISGDDTGNLTVRELVLGRKNQVRVAWYFYKSGSDLSTSYWRHQAGVALRKIWRPDAADVLVRFDVVTREGSIDEARKALREFVAHGFSPLVQALP